MHTSLGLPGVLGKQQDRPGAGRGLRARLITEACLPALHNELSTTVIGRHPFMRNFRNKGAIQFATPRQLSPCVG